MWEGNTDATLWIVPQVVRLLLWAGRFSNPMLRWEFAFDAAQLEDIRRGQIFQGVAEDGAAMVKRRSLAHRETLLCIRFFSYSGATACPEMVW